jgi:hypothetical protein
MIHSQSQSEPDDIGIQITPELMDARAAVRLRTMFGELVV